MNQSKISPKTMLDPICQETAQPEQAICFGPFVLLARQHLLLKDGESVALGSRALYLLIAMASRPGELIEKSELIAFAWPKVVVEECNLRAQIVALRRALGDDGDFGYIVTVPGRGYRFVAPITYQGLTQQPMSIADARPPASSPLPGLIGQVIGREQVVQSLNRQLQSRRFVTLTGPGGVGKTTVALAMANELTAQFPQGMHFVDLAPVTSPQLIPGMLASVLGLNSATEHPLKGIADTHAQQRFLLILDNCEHALEETANAVETILRNAPQSCVLITSREPLHADGEFVHNLASLEVPDEGTYLTASQALGFSGIQLFIERVIAHDPGFVFNDGDVEAVSAICRKLDSNALAIEIAAARVRAFGVQDLVELLDGSLRLQMTGRRTSLPRHRTLSATLDWTYSMLSTEEQMMLRQLSVFTGPFTLAAVKATIDTSTLNLYNALPLLENLMDKSLLIAREQSGAHNTYAIKRYRLLETTRAYAQEKLAQHRETARIARRHALYALGQLHEAGESLDSMPADAWIALYGPEIDTVRAALDWAYSTVGERLLGIELTLVSIPLWLRLSRVGECRNWVNMALQNVGPSAPIMPRQRMLLLTAWASVLMLTYGTGQKMREAWHQVREDAKTLGDTEHKLRALWGLWSDRCCSNQYQEALELAERYIQLTRTENISEHQLLGKRMRATALFYMADLAGARQSINEALSAPSSPRSHIIDVHFDQRIAARCLKAQVQLLEGQVDQGLATIDQSVEQAINLNHPATLWYTLCLGAMPMALMVGDLDKARYFLSLLQDSTTRHDLHLWRQFTLCFENILLIREGSPEEGVPRLGEALNDLREQGDSPLYSLMRCEYVMGLAALGLEQLALEVIDETLYIATSRHEHWFLPEMLRVKAQLMLEQDKAAAMPHAMSVLRQAMAEARNQGAHLWRSRIATDLSRLEEPRLRIAPLHKMQNN